MAIDLASELHTSNLHFQTMQEKYVNVEKKLNDVKSEDKNILKDTSYISRQQEKVKMGRQCFQTEKSKLKMKLKEKEAQHKEEIKSKHEKTKEIKQSLRTVEKENLHLIAMKDSQESKLKRKSLELKAANSRESYQRTKVAKLEEAQIHDVQSNQTKLSEFNDMVIEIDKLKTEIRNLKTENSGLRNQLLEHQLDNLYEDKKVFLPELQTCVYELVSNHVSSSRVSKVIEVVFKNITGIKIKNQEYIIQFANDTTRFLDGSEKTPNSTLERLEHFSHISGLKVNFDKTKLIWIGS